MISRGAELFALEIISPPVACVDEASIRSVPIAREEIIDFSLLFYPNIERTAVSVSLLLEKIGEEKCVFRGFSVEKGGRGSVGAWLLNMVA